MFGTSNIKMTLFDTILTVLLTNLFLIGLIIIKLIRDMSRTFSNRLNGAQRETQTHGSKIKYLICCIQFKALEPKKT